MGNEVNQILKHLTELVNRHDEKLAGDFRSIQRLEKDTEKLTANTGSLSSIVSELAGTVKTQSGIINAVLAVTVLAFLGLVTRTVVESVKKPDEKVMAEAIVRALKTESMVQVAPFDFQKVRKVKLAAKVVQP